MFDNFHRLTDVRVNRRGVIGRRDFLGTVSASAAVAGTLNWPALMTARADDLRQRGMACILLWMQGGPSQLETFDPKPGHANGGETKAIETSVPGIRISENLPNVARAMDDICLIRSMNGREGSHPRATHLMQTGYLPTASVKYPSIGAHAANQLADRSFDLPSYVRIGRGRGSYGGGLLGVEFDPFLMASATRVPDNTTVSHGDNRYRRRLGLLGKLESHYEQHGGRQEVGDHRKLVNAASRMVLSPRMDVFDIEQEPENVRQAYGDSEFGAGCLLARRLVETGATFVEVHAGNWDTHDDNFNRVRDLCTQVDQPHAALLADLKQRGMLDRTLVVWAGEFGRTPKINPRSGRDHYPRAYSAALAGAGVKGGQVIGETDAGGESIKDRPVGVSDFLRTLCQALGLDADIEHMSNIGRPIKVVDGGEVVREVFG
ncbi:MAG: DUF1501 domain-containing protein [Planctomycetales bacterium]|nr:DUF1501 domain-containing protein [Planctomycetales bacterium]